MLRRFFLLIILFSGSWLSAQDVEFYSGLRRKYWEYEENDARAFRYLDIYISSAKKEKNYAELYQAYNDAVRYSANHKLQYADSAIIAAKLSENRDLIGNSYIGKGIVYYFTYRKFQPALDEYLKAYQYTENAKDKFLKYQNLYHIGVVKSYLGYYNEALGIFNECVAYFEPNTKAKIHPNLIFNNEKGYLNSLHQMIVCYQALGNDKKAAKLTDIGFAQISDDKVFFQEKSYFEKAKGILDFNNKDYNSAISEFDKSLVGLIKIDDFTWTSVAYFYRGQSYERLGKENPALENYKKVDSIFNRHHFILPELRGNYEALITYYRKKDDPKQELYYTNQLLKADSIISNDFKYLSARIHRDYDTKDLLEAKENLEHSNFFGKYMLSASGLLILALGFAVFYRIRRQREIQKKYNELLLKINTVSAEKEEGKIPEKTDEKNSKLDPLLIRSLKKRFSEFEKNKGFLEKRIAVGQLASQFGTNTAYLSQFINEFKGYNFNTYINRLRIEYATEKIYSDKEWRKYSVEDISDNSGFSSRQNFSNLFQEINGMRPQDFIKKRKEETELQKVS